MKVNRAVKGALLAATTLALTATVVRAMTDEERCLSGRAKAKGKYEQCVNYLLASAYAGQVSDPERWNAKLAKCRNRYDTDWWAKLWGLGISCVVADRFTDNGDETVTDHLTGLLWEEKTGSSSSLHWLYGTYTWSDPTDSNVTNADGSAFTVFLAGLNTPPCFAGHCDWRLPTVTELQTIVSPGPYPCSSSPCVPWYLLPAVSDFYWSATTDARDLIMTGGYQTAAHLVRFDTGALSIGGKANFWYVRAVRGGL